MKNTALLSSSLSFLLTGFLSIGSAQAHAVLCALSPVMPNYSPLADQPPAPRTARDLKKLTTLMCPKGCGRVSLYQNATVPNAVTVSAGAGVSRIEYSPAFLEKVEEIFGADARLGVIAHELGHHVDVIGAPAPWLDPAWDSELRADAWAGCALAKAGRTTEGLKETLRAVSVQPTAKPDRVWDQRWQALQRGFEGCGASAENGALKVAAFDPRVKVGTLPGGGCGGDADCKLGRVCLAGRCDRRPMSGGVCMKDVDCPDNQICAATGHCETAAGSGSFVSASVTATVPGPEAGAPKTKPVCNAQCGLERRACRVGAARTLNECLRTVTGDAAYKDCQCPGWPSAKPACRQVCEQAFEKADECAAEYGPGRETCMNEAVACRDCR